MIVLRLFLLFATLSTAFGSGPIPLRQLEIREVLPHRRTSFTQCLMEHSSNGQERLIEGTGLYGKSKLMVVRPRDGLIEKAVDLPPKVFGEGCAQIGDELFLLTWKERFVSVRDPQTLLEKRRFSWPREGWGAAAYGDTLWISDGSDTLFQLSTKGELLGKLAVTAGGKPLSNINELAEAGRWLVANIWGRDTVAVIDRRTGKVVEWWDGRPLRQLVPLLERGEMEVLNGIAKAKAGGWWLTGKLWPYLYRVEPKGSLLNSSL